MPPALLDLSALPTMFLVLLVLSVILVFVRVRRSGIPADSCPKPQLARSTVQHVQAASASHASRFAPDKGKLPAPPAKEVVVITCMDARIDPAAAIGLNIGDAHVVRNAGASAVEALRSIIISQQFLGTKEVLVVKHTKCGMVGLENEKTVKVVEAKLGLPAVDELKERNLTDFIGFRDLEGALQDDVTMLKKSKLLKPETEVSGWIYDVVNGTTTRVV